MDEQSTTELKFDHWCIVELVGHQRIAGRVTEVNLFGSAMMRVDIPEVDDAPGFSKFYGANAVYAITPVEERIARAIAKSFDQRPVVEWKLRRLLPEPEEQGDDDDGVYSLEDDEEFDDQDEDEDEESLTVEEIDIALDEMDGFYPPDLDEDDSDHMDDDDEDDSLLRHDNTNDMGCDGDYENCEDEDEARIRVADGEGYDADCAACLHGIPHTAAEHEDYLLRSRESGLEPEGADSDEP